MPRKPTCATRLHSRAELGNFSAPRSLRRPIPTQLRSPPRRPGRPRGSPSGPRHSKLRSPEARAHPSTVEFGCIVALRMSRGEPGAGARGTSARAAERAIVGLVARDLQFEQGARRDIQIEAAPGAIDQGSGGNHEAAFLLDNADGLAGRAARGPNVFDHQDALARMQFET